MHTYATREKNSGSFSKYRQLFLGKFLDISRIFRDFSGNFLEKFQPIIDRFYRYFSRRKKQKNNKKGYVLKVGNIELKSAGPTNVHDIFVNRLPWGTFHMDYESGGTDFWVKPLRGNDFWVKEIDDIVKRVKADSSK